MTKHVRIENADSSQYRVLVQVWDKGYPAGSPDVLVKEVILANPCEMTDMNIYITNTRYLVIKEA